MPLSSHRSGSTVETQIVELIDGAARGEAALNTLELELISPRGTESFGVVATDEEIWYGIADYLSTCREVALRMCKAKDRRSNADERTVTLRLGEPRSKGNFDDHGQMTIHLKRDSENSVTLNLDN